MLAPTTRRRLLIGGGAGVVLAGAGATWAGVRAMGSMADYRRAVAATRSVLARTPQTLDLIRYATLAPNGHNAQPWRFRPGNDRIDILPDLTRRTPVVDPDDHHLFVSLGGAAETIALAGAARGRPGEVAFDPADNEGLTFHHGAGPERPSALFDAITLRQSTRADYDGRTVSPDHLRALEAAAVFPGVDMVLITDRPGRDRLRDLVVAANTAQMADAGFMRELQQWLRFNPTQALRTADGLFTAASGNPILPSWLGPRLFDATFTPRSENDRYARQLASSPGLAVFIGAREDRDHWIRVGQASQRFSLQATALGLKHAYLNQPVEVASLRPELASLIGATGRRPDLVMRFGYGPNLPFSARRPVSALLSDAEGS